MADSTEDRKGEGDSLGGHEAPAEATGEAEAPKAAPGPKRPPKGAKAKLEPEVSAPGYSPGGHAPPRHADASKLIDVIHHVAGAKVSALDHDDPEAAAAGVPTRLIARVTGGDPVAVRTAIGTWACIAEIEVVLEHEAPTVTEAQVADLGDGYAAKRNTLDEVFVSMDVDPALVAKAVREALDPRSLADLAVAAAKLALKRRHVTDGTIHREVAQAIRSAFTEALQP